MPSEQGSESGSAINWLDGLTQAWAGPVMWELLAVLLALAYLVLAVRQNPLCWLAALASTAIYTALFWQVQLLMQSALNLYYLAMAVYGWWYWRHGGQGDRDLPITRWSAAQHALALVVVLACSLLSGWLLSRHSDAAWPYLDSLVTWGAVVTTFMVARKVLENWAWWMLINSLAIVLFLDREMMLTAALHGAYLFISIFGWRRWWLDFQRQQSPA